MKIGIVVCLLIIAVLLEGTITPTPLVWVVLLLIATMQRKTLGFFLGFVAGILLDIFILHPIGESSSIFMVFLFLVTLYERKYETQSLPFVSIASSIGGMFFLIISQETQVLFGGCVALILGGILFFLTHLGKTSSTAPFPARGIFGRTK